MPVNRAARADLVARLQEQVGAANRSVASTVIVALLHLLEVDQDVRHRTVRPDDRLPA